MASGLSSHQTCSYWHGRHRPAGERHGARICKQEEGWAGEAILGPHLPPPPSMILWRGHQAQHATGPSWGWRTHTASIPAGPFWLGFWSANRAGSAPFSSVMPGAPLLVSTWGTTEKLQITQRPTSREEKGGGAEAWGEGAGKIHFAVYFCQVGDFNPYPV